MVKILVVEDEYDIRELLQNYLENEGYQVVTASDGERPSKYSAAPMSI